jgi:uncharacterized protein DUF1203
MSFIVTGLPVETFQPLFGLSDAQLSERGAMREVAGAVGRYPCRVTLSDAEPGERLLLVNYEHQSAPTPYRSAYAIYVNEAAAEAARFEDELPPVLRGRPIALRAFDADGMLIGAELALNDDVAEAIARRFADPAAAYLHAHNAAHGCFAARIDRP